jgi:hypothetical protein
MFGVISRFLITPRVFALFKSGLSLRCLPLLPLYLPMFLKKPAICLFAYVEYFVALIFGDLRPARFCFCLQGELLKYLLLRRVYKPYTLFEQLCSYKGSPSLLKRYIGEILRFRPWRLSHESVLCFLMLLFSKTKQNQLKSWPEIWFYRV